ncbi:MAG: YesL family protein [Solobacterium sp.]|nr:YesL family protein [Solobacterium sp.]MBR2769580.1 YesL family protein [Solobacterium sp.]
MDFLRPDSKFMTWLGLLANLMILNFITLFTCIPIITAGASLTAMHYVLQKIVREEDNDLIGQFFHSFKMNFKQATIIWVILVFVFAVLFVDWRILRMQGDEFPGFFIILMYGAIAIVYLISLYVFPVLARYKNTIGGTFKTSFALAVYGITMFRTFICGLVNLVPMAVLYIFGYPVIPVFLAFCFTGPGFVRARIYRTLFSSYEQAGQVETAETEEKNEERDS